MTSTSFIPHPGAIQIAVNVDWEDHTKAVPEYPVWVIPLEDLCPNGKRAFRVVDPRFSTDKWPCECHARIIE